MINDLPLNQLITVVFDVEEPKRHVIVVIEDASDDDAAVANEDWARKAFTLDDLFGSIVVHAEVTVTENDGVPEHYTGESFDGGAVLRELDGVDPSSVTFADYLRRAPLRAYGDSDLEPPKH